ncbi:hypothetical protein PInf_014402 [Phytophthora infestans]|nr:hypothetical protein PInf_014402 [Phytophthora infestans]
MAHSGAVDQDGDVEMKAAKPVLEYIKPPRLTDLGQPALVKFVRDRRQYEEKIWERSLATGEAHETVLVSIKSSMEPRILGHLAHYEFRTTVGEVTEARPQEDIARRAGTLMNDHIPDVTRLFSNSLKMDMKVADIYARVVKYFMDFDQLVDEHGLMAWVGRDPMTDAAGRQRMKTRCKLLISKLLSTVLRVDIERLVAMTHQHAKLADVALYELIVGRAKY